VELWKLFPKYMVLLVEKPHIVLSMPVGYCRIERTFPEGHLCSW
jgi:hypothetical protein